jgi:DNA-binding NarL/FixJ family response regulator
MADTGATARLKPGADDLVGRDEELTRLRGFLKSETGPAALLVEGEAGIGKTSLWKAGIAAARANGHHVLACRPGAAEASLSYAALGDLLGPSLDGTLSILPPPQRQALEVALLLREPDGPPPDQRAIGLSLVTALHALSRSSPVLVAIDDTQWVDPASAAPLEFAARRMGGDRIQVLAAIRIEEGSSAHLRLERALGDDGIVRVRLGPLSLGAIHRLIRSRLDVAMPRSVLIRVHEASAGNPFFALEIARAIVGRGGRLDAGERLAVPDNLDEILAARFAGLPPAVAGLLAAAATMSEPTVSGLSDVVEADRDAIIGQIDAAVAAGIISVHEDRVTFTHPLLASTAYWRIDITGRRRLHRRVAAQTTDVEEHARHLALAAVGPDEEVAIALDEAARHAGSRGATDAAAELAELATRMTAASQLVELRRRRYQAAERLIDVGDLGRSRQILEDLVRELPPGGERVDVKLRLARTREDDIEAQRAILETALPEAEGDPRRLARVYRSMAEAAAVRGDQSAALAHARASITPAEASGDTRLLVSALAYVGLFETFLGTITPGLLERAVDLEPSVGYLPAYESPSMVLGYRLLYLDRFAEAREHLLVAVSNSAAHDDASAHLTALLHLAELEVMTGDWERAAPLASDGLELAEQLDADHSRAALLYIGALVDALLGRVDTARARANRGVELSRASGSDVYEALNGWVLGFVDLSSGDHVGAVATLEPLLDLRIASTPRGLSRVLPLLVEALVGAGDIARGRALTADLEGSARAVARPTATAAAARCRGLVLAAQGEPQAAFAAFLEALRSLEGIDAPFDRARTLLSLGQAQRRARRRQAARQSLEAACALLERLGATLWAQQARLELARIGGRAPSAGALTSTEERVAALVAGGYTNREAASSLHLSEHTVEGHLSHIYAKLGVRSRTELARSFVRDRHEQAPR